MASINFSRTVTPLQFGAVGDCVADDTNALLAMRDELLKLQAADLSNTVGFVIQSPAGKCYKYTNNRWTWGLKRLKLQFNGSTIQNVGTAPSKALNDTFISNRSPFYANSIDAPYNSVPYTYGSFIKTALKGATSVSLDNPSDARDFHPGGYALVMAYSQNFSGNFPPDPRYFDYVKITSLNGNTLVLDRPLTADYRADYPELPGMRNPCGRARILSLDRDIPFAEYFEADGIKVIANPFLHTNDKPGYNFGVHNEDYFIVSNTYTVVIRDCDVVAFIPTVVHDATIINSQMVNTEPDKIIDNVRFVNCKINQTSGATGVKNLEVEGGSIDGIAFFNPRKLTIKGTTLNGATQSHGGYASLGANIFTTPTKSVTITGAILNGKGAPSDRYIADAQEMKLKIDGVNVKLSDNTVTALLSYRDTQRFLGCIDEGDRVLVEATPPDAVFRYGIVKSIRGDGPDAVINFAFNQPLQDNDALSCVTASEMTLSGNQYSNFNTTSSDWNSLKPLLPKHVFVNFENNTSVGGEQQSWSFSTLDSIGQAVSVSGNLVSLTVNVTKPYSGSENGAFLNIDALNPAVGLKEVINLQTPGTRQINASGVVGNQVGDQLTNLADQHLDILRLHYSTQPGGPAKKLAGGAAEFSIQIQLQKPDKVVLKK